MPLRREHSADMGITTFNLALGLLMLAGATAFILAILVW
jgi:hypothetical protein